jgi:hypothetical protein
MSEPRPENLIRLPPTNKSSLFIDSFNLANVLPLEEKEPGVFLTSLLIVMVQEESI